MFAYSLDPFTITFPHTTREVFTWDREIRLGALKIAERAGDRPIWLCLSGGIDSEVVAEAFYAEKIPFKGLSLSYGGRNEHDIKFARVWCRKRKIEHKVVPISLEDFLLDEAPVLAETYLTNSSFRFLQLKLLQTVTDLGGFAVLGGGEQLYKLEDKLDDLSIADLYLEFDIGYPATLEWCKNNGIDHEPYFFFSTPEIVKAWTEIPYIKFVLENPDILKHPANRNTLKMMVIRSQFPQQQWRMKYNGFERLLNLRRHVERKLVAQKGDSVKTTYKLPVVELLKQLG